MNLTLRDYQGAVKSFMHANDRCGILAGMGTGKTGATLMALQELSMVHDDVFPALVLAPLRVATTTWPDEVAKWDNINLKIVAVVGSAADRRAALAQKADIYTTNYENLPWLCETLGDDWPFQTVVADESTKLKSFRTRQGSKRAKALGAVAHTRVKRFYALTGTPSPRGIGDLWGQMWFIDQGSRLGRSFAAFSNRWFRPDYSGFGLIPLPNAQKEIQAAIKDVCITISAADYMDLPELIENDVVVDLPRPARTLYRDMERTMFAEIGAEGVEANNAAARTNKCLQIAAGAIYTDGQEWEEVHDAKLDALEDIVEEAAGMPILVSYQFKSDLARILKRFGKRARHLDQNPKTITDFNAGKIDILCAHPASAGHGLNLQYGSNILVYFSSGWNLEEDMQILERIGPTRQYQAGLNREVYVHRIVARDTVDELVATSRQTKRSVQDVLLEAMKKHKGNT
jgi:SNF2 family DNA or RNA helicase